MNSYCCVAAMVMGLWLASTGSAEAVHIKIKVRVPDIHHPGRSPVEVTVTGVSGKPIFHQSIQAALSVRIPNVPKVPTTEEAFKAIGLEMKAYCVKYREPALPHQPSDSNQNWAPPDQNQSPQAAPPPSGLNPGAPWKKEDFHSRLGIDEVKIRVDLNVGNGNVDWVKSGGCALHPEN